MVVCKIANANAIKKEGAFFMVLPKVQRCPASRTTDFLVSCQV